MIALLLTSLCVSMVPLSGFHFTTSLMKKKSYWRRSLSGDLLALPCESASAYPTDCYDTPEEWKDEE